MSDKKIYTGKMEDGSKFVTLHLNDNKDELNVYEDGSVDSDIMEIDIKFSDLLNFVETTKSFFKD